ncbi:hypothetical protein CN918_31740 [Priestia megaterium]|nr:hypothetical protein CN918_31740 [Priestia megaterium]
MSNQKLMQTISELKELSIVNIQRNRLKIKLLKTGYKHYKYKPYSQVISECTAMEEEIQKYKIDFRKYLTAEHVTFITEAIQNNEDLNKEKLTNIFQQFAKELLRIEEK